MQGLNLNRPLRSRRKVRKGFIIKQAILGVLGVFAVQGFFFTARFTQAAKDAKRLYVRGRRQSVHRILLDRIYWIILTAISIHHEITKTKNREKVL